MRQPSDLGIYCLGNLKHYCWCCLNIGYRAVAIFDPWFYQNSNKLIFCHEYMAFRNTFLQLVCFWITRDFCHERTTWWIYIDWFVHDTTLFILKIRYCCQIWKFPFFKASLNGWFQIIDRKKYALKNANISLELSIETIFVIQKPHD